MINDANIDRLLSHKEIIDDKLRKAIYDRIRYLAIKALKRYQHLTEFCMAMGMYKVWCKCNDGEWTWQCDCRVSRNREE